MKSINKIIVSFALLSFLTSCQSKPNEEKPNPKPDDGNNDNPPVTEKDYFDNTLKSLSSLKAYELIKDVSTSPSYRLNYLNLLDAKQNEYYILNSSYYYSSSSNSGYILKESYDKSLGSSLVYQFFYENNSVELLHPLKVSENNKETILNDLSYFNNFKVLANEYKDYYDDSSFSLDADQLITKNKYLINTFSSFFSLSKENISLIDHLALNLNKNDDLVINFINKKGKNLLNRSLIVSDISKAKVNELDKYLLTNYKIGNNRLNESYLDKLDLSKNEFVSFHNEANVYIDHKDQGVNQISDYTYSLNKSEVIATDPVSGEQIKEQAINNNGNTARYGYLANNTIGSISMGKYYDWNTSFINYFDLLKEEKDAFVLENGRFVYYGFNYDKLFSSISYLSISSSPSHIYLNLKDNKVDSLSFVFPLEEYTHDDGSFIYNFNVNCSISNAKKIEELEAFKDDETSTLLDEALTKLNGSHNIKAKATNLITPQNEFITTLKDDILLFEENNLTYGGTVASFKEGYVKKDKGIARFIVDKNGNVLQNGDIITGKKLSDYIAKGTSGTLFKKKENGTYVLKDFVLNDLGSHLLLSNKGKYMSGHNYEMEVDETNKNISSITYAYTDSYFNKSQEKVTYEYEGFSIDQGLLTKINSMANFKEPTYWNDEDETIANKMTSLFREESKNIPYIYLADTYLRWSSTLLYDELTLYNSNDHEVDETFYSLYREALIKKGYKKVEDPSYPGGEIYELGHIRVRLAKILVGGLYFSKI